MTPASYRVIISPRALRRLEGIFEYIFKDSPVNAVEMFDELMEAIDSLVNLPHRYAVNAAVRFPPDVVRLMPVPPYVVYYRIDEPLRLVRVMTVLHGRQRRPRRFEP